MQWTYALWNVAIGGGTLMAALLWLPQIHTLWRPMLRGWLLVSIPWIVLDALSVANGWWQYNERYIVGPKIFGLPIEEIAFFITVPFACMVVYMLVARHVHGQVASKPKVLAVAIALVLLLTGAWVYADSLRTVVDILLTIATLIVLLGTSLGRYRAYWAWVGISALLCFACNSILTGLPIVEYDASYMSGWRLGTIPIEDFLYNYSLLTLMALVVRPDRLALATPE
jgi:lycopene cyclase domain-containing protein